nr:MAG TPA: hypothetical protein [Caudoviricetes sp.]
MNAWQQESLPRWAFISREVMPLLSHKKMTGSRQKINTAILISRPG